MPRASTTWRSTTTTGPPGSCATCLGERRPRRRDRSTRSAIPASSCISATTQSGAFVLIKASDHETSEVFLLDRTTPMPGPAPGRAAHAAPELLGRASRRAPVHPHQRGRGGGLQDRHRARRDAGPRALARPRPPPARGDDPPRRVSPATSSGSSARTRSPASSCATSHRARSTRSPSPRRPTPSACDAGYEFDTDVIRYHLLVADDAEPRSATTICAPARGSCASARRCRAGTIRPPT